jgi:predicted transcriptional regulator
MAMTLRLTDEESEALRTQAEAEGRSMQEVARAAVRQYIALDGHRSRVDAAATAGAERYADALRRLGEV